jgi:hypothetical protein
LRAIPPGGRRTFVLIPGAGGAAWYWHRLAPLLREAGHEAIAVDLPGDDAAAGLPEYADLVARAIGNCGNPVLVAQSLGGFTAPLVAAKVPLAALVFVNAMIPSPGETPGAWWDNTGWAAARIAAAERGGYSAEVDLAVYFLHDVAPEVAAAGEPYQRPEADAAFQSPCDFSAWPNVPIRAVAGADDRFFPVGFQQALMAHFRDALRHRARRAQRHLGVTQPAGQHGAAVAHALIIRMCRGALAPAVTPVPGERGEPGLHRGADSRIEFLQRLGGGDRHLLAPRAQCRRCGLPGGGELPCRVAFLTTHDAIFAPTARCGQRRGGLLRISPIHARSGRHWPVGTTTA